MRTRVPLSVFLCTPFLVAVLFLGMTVRSVHATSGLVGLWTLDDGSGNTAADSSGIGNDAAIAGTATWVSGKIGGALSLDGSSNYARVASFASAPSSTMTLCSWIKTSSPTDQFIFSFSRNPNGNNNEGIFKLLSNGHVQFWDYGNSYGFPANGNSSGRAVADGAWHLVCFVKNGTSGTYYTDGAADGTVTAATDVTYGTNDWIIGSDYRDHTSYFNGLLDDARIYNTALSAQQIAVLYGLIGYWKFDDGSGSTALDSSGYDDHGSLVNSPTWSTGQVAGALTFSGGSKVSIPDAPVLSPIDGISMSAWVKTTTNASREVIVSKTAGGNNTWLFEISPSDCGSAKLHFFVVTGGAGHDFCSTTALSTDTWYHVAATYDGATAKIYINGVQDGSLSIAGAIATNALPVIVGNWGDSDRPWEGQIDDVRLYSRGLLGEEVASLAAVLPSTVTNLSASGTFHSGFLLTWDANLAGENVTDYIVEYSTDNQSTWTAIDTGSSQTSYTYGGNGPGDYFFRVSAVNSIGQGGPSTVQEVNSLAGSYSISDCAALQDIANDPGDQYGTYTLTADIDCSDIPNFVPISFDNFMGTFDGDGHTISNLTIDSTDGSEFGGLFEGASGATFKDLTFHNGSIQGVYQLGALVGWAENTTILNVHSDLPVSSTQSWGYSIGGLVGELDSYGAPSSITNSSTEGTVSGGWGIGGILGYSFVCDHCTNDPSSIAITNSFATGSVIGTGGDIGGLVGDVEDDDGSYDQILTIDQSYATGDVHGNENVGGLVGYGYNFTVTNSYAEGDVSGQNQIGGLIGYAENAVFVDTTYATGDIVASNVDPLNVLDAYAAGGLIGYMYESDFDSGNPHVQHSYATGSVTGQNYTGGLIGELDYSSRIENVYATGAVQGTYLTGGLIGYYLGETDPSEGSYVRNAYASGSVTGTQTDGGSGPEGDIVGGLIGQHHGGYLQNSFATGLVTSDENAVGGLVGEVDDDLLTNNFYDTTRSGQAQCSPEYDNVDGCLPISDANYFFNTTTNPPLDSWDFDTVWHMHENALPTFGIDTPVNYTLTYVAGPHGTISGTTTQTIASGDDGSSVTAVPDAGYVFAEWDDSTTTATRTDTNILADHTYTASFTPIPVPKTGLIIGNTIPAQVAFLIQNGNLEAANALKAQFPNLFSSTTVLPIGFTFVHNLRQGSMMSDVHLLQMYLNSHGFLVSTTGPGSKGNETNRFGTHTRAALAAFQKAHQISPAIGFFGPITRGYVNSHL